MSSVNDVEVGDTVQWKLTTTKDRRASVVKVHSQAVLDLSVKLYERHGDEHTTIANNLGLDGDGPHLITDVQRGDMVGQWSPV